MSDEAKVITFDWLKTLLPILTALGMVVGVYVNMSNRVTAAEQRIIQLEGNIGEYKSVPATLARIEEQINGMRKDVTRMENRIR